MDAKKQSVKIGKAKNNSAFTLIELLVVLAIIGILAGMIGSAVTRGLKTAKQVRDVNNMHQVGLVLITESMDSNGVFRAGLTVQDTELSSTTLQVMQGLVNDGLLDDPHALVGEGTVSATTLILTDKNVGFQYVAGHTGSSPSRLPLLFTKGVGVEKSSLTSDRVGKGTSAWGSEGVGVCYVAGNAAWIRGKAEGNEIKLNEPLGIGEIPQNLTIYK